MSAYEQFTGLDIPLRGDRAYVHSSDLFAALQRLAAATLSTDAYLQSLALRRTAIRQVAATFKPRDDSFGNFVLRQGDITRQGWLVETAESIRRRISFDESGVRQAAVNCPGRVFLAAPVRGYTSFEQLIVLFKMLCAQLRPGAWLFTGVQLARPLQEEAPLELCLHQTVFGRMIQAELRQNRQPIGRAQMVLNAESFP